MVAAVSNPLTRVRIELCGYWTTTELRQLLLVAHAYWPLGLSLPPLTHDGWNGCCIVYYYCRGVLLWANLFAVRRRLLDRILTHQK
jgi:hypothetical protein